MAKLKKNIARLILQGITIIGILCGGLLVIGAFDILLKIQREDLAVLFGSLIFSAVLLVIGVYLIYSSYRMLRLRAFTVATRGIPTTLAVCVFFMVFIVAERVMSWADTLANEGLARYVRLSCALVSLLVVFLGVSVFTKLSKRLLEAANVQPDLGESDSKLGTANH
jgi:divalent metal cation (Fe/Co/Zn/Cd) transporter